MELSPPEFLPDGRVQVGVVGTDIKGVGDTFANAAADARRLAKQKQPSVKPRRSRPVTPDKEQSAEEQLDRAYDEDAKKYLPVADELLKKHRLTVPEYRRARLAKTFWEMRELPADKRRKGEEPDAKNHVYLNCEGFVDGKPRYERVEAKPGDPVILHSIESIEGQAVRQAVKVEPLERPPPKKELRSPVPGLRSAQKHIAKLLEYAEKPPAHKGRVATRCANLRTALLNAGGHGAFALAMESSDDRTDYGKLLDALEKGYALETKHLEPSQRRNLEAQRDRLSEEYNALMDKRESRKAIDAERWWNECDHVTEEYVKTCEALEVDWGGVKELRKLRERIDRILARNEDWRKVPPPSPLTTRIVKTGWLAWNAAGRRRKEYYQDSRYGKEKLTGPLPDFLRDLIACCNGTHDLVRKPPPRTSKYRPPPWPRMGDWLAIDDEALHSAIQRQEAFYREHVLPILKKGD